MQSFTGQLDFTSPEIYSESRTFTLSLNINLLPFGKKGLLSKKLLLLAKKILLLPKIYSQFFNLTRNPVPTFCDALLEQIHRNIICYSLCFGICEPFTNCRIRCLHVRCHQHHFCYYPSILHPTESIYKSFKHFYLLVTLNWVL